jgi:hypothetical protein
MAAKKGKQRKALPTWVSIVVIIVVIAGIAVVYSMKKGPMTDAYRDPEMQKLVSKFDQDIQNYDFFKKRSPALQQQLIDQQRVPKEWGEGNPVPWYDPKGAGKTTETPAPTK